MELNYYVAEDFSADFYVKLARAGFISTTIPSRHDTIYLLPEIQFTYAVLELDKLHIGKKVKKLLKQENYDFLINQNFEDVLEAIKLYHEDCWIEEHYTQMLLELYAQNRDDFKLYSFELLCKNENRVVAAEIGYKIGKTYTSLTGFFRREKRYNNYGKLQMALLNNYLKKEGYDFWNLGHACLQYKLDMGAKVLERADFLKKWKKSI